MLEYVYGMLVIYRIESTLFKPYVEMWILCKNMCLSLNRCGGICVRQVCGVFKSAKIM